MVREKSGNPLEQKADHENKEVKPVQPVQNRWEFRDDVSPGMNDLSSDVI